MDSFGNIDSCQMGVTVGSSGIVDNNQSHLEVSVFPNPLQEATTFEYVSKEPGKTILKIYNHLGIEIEAIVNEHQQGKQQIIWNAKGLSPGIYFYRIKIGDQQTSGKMVVIR